MFAGVRNPNEAKSNVESLIDIESMKGKIYYEQLDTGSMQSVRKFAKVVQSKFSKIDILINNGNYFVITKNLQAIEFKNNDILKLV